MPQPQSVESQGAARAAHIEDIYIHQGARAAEEELRKEFLNTNANDPKARKDLQDEVEKLKADDKVNHVFGHIALEWAKPLAQDDKLSKSTLGMMSTMLGDSSKDMFNKTMAEGVIQHYGELTSLTSLRHDGHLLNPLNWGRGIMDTDIERVEHDFEKQRQKTQVVVEASELFLKDNGALFKRIAGDRGTIDKDTMIHALEADKKEDPKNRRFNDQERKAVQTMVDNWDDPAVNQLKNNHWKDSDYAKVVASTIPIVGAVPGAQHGWRNGYEWGGVLGGLGGGFIGAIAGATGIGGGIIEGVHRGHAAGELTMETMANAAKNNPTAVSTIRYDLSHQKPTESPPPAAVQKPVEQPPAAVQKPVEQPPAAVQKPVEHTPEVPKPVVQKPVEHPPVKKPGEHPPAAVQKPVEHTPEVPKPVVQKPVEHPPAAVQKPIEHPPAGQKPGEKPAKPKEEDLADDVIRKGDSYWRMAARHLGKDATPRDILRETRRLQELNENKPVLFDPNKQRTIKLEEEYID